MLSSEWDLCRNFVLWLCLSEALTRMVWLKYNTRKGRNSFPLNQNETFSHFQKCVCALASLYWIRMGLRIINGFTKCKAVFALTEKFEFWNFRFFVGKQLYWMGVMIKQAGVGDCQPYFLSWEEGNGKKCQECQKSVGPSSYCGFCSFFKPFYNL